METLENLYLEPARLFCLFVCFVFLCEGTKWTKCSWINLASVDRAPGMWIFTQKYILMFLLLAQMHALAVCCQHVRGEPED